MLVNSKSPTLSFTEFFRNWFVPNHSLGLLQDCSDLLPPAPQCLSEISRCRPRASSFLLFKKTPLQIPSNAVCNSPRAFGTFQKACAPVTWVLPSALSCHMYTCCWGISTLPSHRKARWPTISFPESSIFHFMLLHLSASPFK